MPSALLLQCWRIGGDPMPSLPLRWSKWWVAPALALGQDESLRSRIMVDGGQSLSTFWPTDGSPGLLGDNDMVCCFLGQSLKPLQGLVTHFRHSTGQILSGVDQSQQETHIEEPGLQLCLGMCLLPLPLLFFNRPTLGTFFVRNLLWGTSSALQIHFLFCCESVLCWSSVFILVYFSELFELLFYCDLKVHLRSVTSLSRSEQCALERAYSWCGVLAECWDILAWCQAKLNPWGGSLFSIFTLILSPGSWMPWKVDLMHPCIQILNIMVLLKIFI